MATSTGTTPQSLPWLLQPWRCFSPLVVLLLPPLLSLLSWVQLWHRYLSTIYGWGHSKQTSRVCCCLHSRGPCIYCPLFGIPPALTSIQLISISVAETASLSPPVATLFLTLAPTSDSRKELQRVIVSLFLPLILWKITAKVKQGQDIDLGAHPWQCGPVNNALGSGGH